LTWFHVSEACPLLGMRSNLKRRVLCSRMYCRNRTQVSEVQLLLWAVDLLGSVPSVDSCSERKTTLLSITCHVDWSRADC
jgi:hypothetical protein